MMMMMMMISVHIKEYTSRHIIRFLPWEDHISWSYSFHSKPFHKPFTVFLHTTSKTGTSPNVFIMSFGLDVADYRAVFQFEFIRIFFPFRKKFVKYETLQNSHFPNPFPRILPICVWNEGRKKVIRFLCFVPIEFFMPFPGSQVEKLDAHLRARKPTHILGSVRPRSHTSTHCLFLSLPLFPSLTQALTEELETISW